MRAVEIPKDNLEKVSEALISWVCQAQKHPSHHTNPRYMTSNIITHTVQSLALAYFGEKRFRKRWGSWRMQYTRWNEQERTGAQYVCIGVGQPKQIKKRLWWRITAQYGLAGQGTGCQQGESTQLYTHADEPLPLPSWRSRLPHCEGRRGCPTAMEPSSSWLMCPWSFVKADYLLLQTNCT